MNWKWSSRRGATVPVCRRPRRRSKALSANEAARVCGCKRHNMHVRLREKRKIHTVIDSATLNVECISGDQQYCIQKRMLMMVVVVCFG